MDKRYQVFVSSTYVDLVEERSEVMQALLELECMPAGMEIFPAANDTQWDWIRKVIDESDYYIVLVGGRYGSLNKKTGASYTEMEYRYAIDIGKPVLGFIREDPENIPSKFAESTDEKKQKLEAFRELVQTRLCKFYNSPADLGAKVSRSITQLKKQFPAVGWVRADEFDSIVTAEEQLKLSRENEDLRAKLSALEKTRASKIENLAAGKDLYEVTFSFSIQGKNQTTGRLRKIGEGDEKILVSWDDLLKAIGPELLRKSGYWGDRKYDLIDLIAERSLSAITKKYPDADSFSNYAISPKHKETIFMQFRALGLLEIGKDGRWKLTSTGDRYLSELFAVRKPNEEKPTK